MTILTKNLLIDPVASQIADSTIKQYIYEKNNLVSFKRLSIRFFIFPSPDANQAVVPIRSWRQPSKGHELEYEKTADEIHAKVGDILEEHKRLYNYHYETKLNKNRIMRIRLYPD